MPRPKALFRCGYRERSRGEEAFWLAPDLTDRSATSTVQRSLPLLQRFSARRWR